MLLILPHNGLSHGWLIQTISLSGCETRLSGCLLHKPNCCSIRPHQSERQQGLLPQIIPQSMLRGSRDTFRLERLHQSQYYNLITKTGGYGLAQPRGESARWTNASPSTTCYHRNADFDLDRFTSSRPSPQVTHRNKWCVCPLNWAR